MNSAKPVDCLRCRHFFVTWDKYFPRGCRAMGFKGKEIPSLFVSRTSGMACRAFEEKERTNRK